MHDKMISQALEAEKAFPANEELMSAEEWAEKDLLDRQAHQQYWEEKGREEGCGEERTSLIKYMLNQGRNIEDISSITGYPIDEVKSVSSNKIL